MQIKNVLVTGASGKVGRHLIPALVQQGYNVRAMQFNTPLEFDNVEVVQGSMSSRDFVAKAIEDIDAICHLATCKESENFLDVSIKGIFNLLETSRNVGGLKQFLLAGGDGSLGIWFYPHPYPLDENTPLQAYPGLYILSKVLEETMCNQYAIQYGLPITILRFSWIHEDDDLLAHMTLKEPNFGVPVWKELAVTAEQKALFEKDQDAAACLLHPGGSAYKRHIVGVQDVVQAFLLALGNERAVGETFNIAAPSAFSYDALSRYISEKLDIPVVEFERDGRYDFQIDINKARAVLGYRPGYDVFRLVDEAIEFRKSNKGRKLTKYQG
ncbi:MAG: NAD-dependent epimerase/dehydratase family protein [Actinobacteria bacterium]|nr:NAD-dependent epimerase/dehydratase family protein [Actinomycetota bacterium]